MAKAISLCPKCGELVLHIFRCTECENYLEEEWDLRHFYKYPPDPPNYDEKTGRVDSRQCRECGNNTFEPEEESEYCSGCEHFLEREMEA